MAGAPAPLPVALLAAQALCENLSAQASSGLGLAFWGMGHHSFAFPLKTSLCRIKCNFQPERLL